jgi:hypothetical protein
MLIECGEFCKSAEGFSGHGMLVMFDVTAPVEGYTP